MRQTKRQRIREEEAKRSKIARQKTQKEAVEALQAKEAAELKKMLLSTQIKVKLSKIMWSIVSMLCAGVLFLVAFNGLFFKPHREFSDIIVVLWVVGLPIVLGYGIRSIIITWQLYRDKAVVIIFSEEGVLNRRLNIYLKWSDIKGVEVSQYKTRYNVYVELYDCEVYSDQLTSIRKYLFKLWGKESILFISDNDNMDRKVEEVGKMMEQMYQLAQKVKDEK